MLEDLRAVLDEPVLVMPVGDRTVTVKPCTAATWLQLQEISSRTEKTGDIELFKLALGEPLFADVITWVTGPELAHIGTTAYIWQLGGTTLAEQFWSSGGKAPASATKTPTRTRRTTRTAAESSTRQRASGSGTSTRRKNSVSDKA